MSSSVLHRYLDPEVLSHVADRHLEPRGLVIGNLAGAHKSPLAGFAVKIAGHHVLSALLRYGIEAPVLKVVMRVLH